MIDCFKIISNLWKQYKIQIKAELVQINTIIHLDLIQIYQIVANDRYIKKK